MSWPVNPINGQQTSINGITYQYNSTTSLWDRIGQTPITVSNNSFTTSGIYITGLTQLQQSQEKFVALTGATGVVTHNFSLGCTFYHTSIAGNFTANITNLTTDSSYTTVIGLILVQGSTPYICNALQIAGVSKTINWLNGTVPTGTSNYVDIIIFYIFNNSGTYKVLGQLATYG
mgnify:CR=1 FL=1